MNATLGIGTWWVYFNSHDAAPLAWCVCPSLDVNRDATHFEIAVQRVEINAPSTTLYRGTGNKGLPSAVLVVHGLLSIEDGKAVIDTPKKAVSQ